MVQHKKVWRVWLGGCLAICLLLAGCSSNNSASSESSAAASTTKAEATSSSSPDSSAAAVDPKANEQVTLKWLMLGPGKQQDSDKVWAAFNEKLAEYLPNTKVEFEIVPNAEYANRWNLMAASGEDVDLVWAGWLVPFIQEVSKDAYYPLDDLIKQYAPDIEKEIPALVLNRARVGGKLYAIDNQQLGATFGPSFMGPKTLIDQYMDVNKLQQVNFALDTTTTEAYAPMEDYLKALKDAGKLDKGAGIVSLVRFAQLRGYEQIGVAAYKIGDNDFKLINTYEAPEVKESYRLAADWFKKGYIRKDILSMKDPRSDDAKAGGSVLWGHNHTEEGIVTFPADEKAGNVEYYKIPLSDKGFVGATITATSTAIARNSKHPERAMQFLNLMQTEKGKDLYNLLVWGIEGEHYKVVSDNRIETIGYSGQGTADAKYGLWKWVIGNTYNSYETQADKPGILAFYKKSIDEAVKSKLMGFQWNSDDVGTEVAQIKAILKEYTPGLESGALANWEERYDEMIAKMKKAGIDKIIEKVQAQVDDFVAKQGIK